MRNLANPNILIAAEQPTEAMLLESMLNASGYPNVRVTTDGREIQPLFEKWPFDVLILDMELSTVSAVQTIRNFSHLTANRRMAVVALSEVHDGALQSIALEAGVSAILTRPYTRLDTVAHVQEALASRSGKTAGGPMPKSVERRRVSMS